MAVWHFKFNLIPTAGLQRVLGRIDGIVPEYVVKLEEGPTYEEGREFPRYWEDSAALRQAAMVVSAFLPEMKSWSDDARMFGDDVDDRIEVWDDNINCRMNMQTFNYALLNHVFELAKRFQCKIVINGTGAIANPDLDSLAPHVEASSAYKYCVSPIDFLKALK